jgi:hypothetical protein
MVSSASCWGRPLSSPRTKPSGGSYTTKLVGRRQVTVCFGHGRRRSCKFSPPWNNLLRHILTSIITGLATPELAHSPQLDSTSGLGFSSPLCKSIYLARPYSNTRTDSFSPLAVFQTVDQPAVVSGNYTAAGFCFAIAIFAVALAYLQHRESQSGELWRKQQDSDEGKVGVASGEIAGEPIKDANISISAISAPPKAGFL